MCFRCGGGGGRCSRHDAGDGGVLGVVVEMGGCSQGVVVEVGGCSRHDAGWWVFTRCGGGGGRVL